jgi:hypothetical protein
MVHLVGRRDAPRSGTRADVKVYANVAHVTLQVDGTILSTQAATDHIAIWQGLELPPGVHRLTATGDGKVTDSIEWTVGEAGR